MFVLQRTQPCLQPIVLRSIRMMLAAVDSLSLCVSLCVRVLLTIFVHRGQPNHLPKQSSCKQRGVWPDLRLCVVVCAGVFSKRAISQTNWRWRRTRESNRRRILLGMPIR